MGENIEIIIKNSVICNNMLHATIDNRWHHPLNLKIIRKRSNENSMNTGNKVMKTASVK